MPDFLSIPVEEYLNQLSSGDPIPGGGSAAALSGAMGAALLCMSARFTIGRERYQQYEETARMVVSVAEEVRAALQLLVEKDSEAYGGYGAAMALPKSTEEEKARRAAAIQQATKDSAQAPLEIARHCCQLLTLAGTLAVNCNPNLVSDVVVATELALSGFRSAVLNVRMNLNYLDDAAFVAQVRDELLPLVAQAPELAQQALNSAYEVLQMPQEGV